MNQRSVPFIAQDVAPESAAPGHAAPGTTPAKPTAEHAEPAAQAIPQTQAPLATASRDTDTRASSATDTAIGVPLPHESAALHVSGEATYTDDIPELHGTLHAALGLSRHAHARIVSLDLDAVKNAPGVIAVFTADDIPGENNCGPVVHDDPILADGEVLFLGQPVFVVIATSHDLARRAAALAKSDDVVRYEPLEAVLTAAEAKAKKQFVLPPLHLKRGAPAEKIAAAPHRLTSTFEVGGQEQFYLEGQIAYALPKEMDGMLVYSSTQHPTEMQLVVAHMLGWPAHSVVCECRRMGGGFGGKESQSAIFACIAALAAYKLHRPIKLRADRDDDFMITGKRHDAVYEYEAGFDDTGRILGARVDIALRAGFSADLSGAVATRALCHFDNAYYLSDVEIVSLACKTNTQSNTAFRGFGGPQGALVMEVLLDDIAHELGLDPLDVRRANFYGIGERDITPYGQRVEDNIVEPLVDELVASSDYRARRAALAELNAQSPVLKRGIALTPVKFGISFNVPFLNQAGALVHVYKDGSVLVNHGGTEMGQGLNTKVAQVVANEFGLALSQVRATATDTSKVANTSATAASTGSDINGKAAEDAARKIRERLASVAVTLLGGEARNVTFARGEVQSNGASIPFAQLVNAAYLARVQLWSDGFYATPKVHWDSKTLTGHPFYYFAYGAAVSEVVIDTLTGEWKLLRADLLHDAGRSINPAIDIGQIEGGFIQGMGWLTTEELWWNRDGRLMTHAPSTYKIPAVSDTPAAFNVRLYRNDNAEPTVFRSKAVGEPPLLLAFSVLLAIRDAIAATAADIAHDEMHTVRRAPPLRAPATPEAILDALDALRADATILPGQRPNDKPVGKSTTEAASATTPAST
jgi:xanthine dehydrogenase large subunit